MSNDYTVPLSDEIYFGQINDSESDLESLLGLCQLGIGNDTGILVYKNHLGEAFKALRGDDLLSGYIMIPSDENISVLERTGIYSNGYDIRLPDNRYIGNETYNNMLRLTDSNVFIVDADETVTGDLSVTGNIITSEGSYIGCTTDPELMCLYEDTLEINGNVQIDTDAYIGSDSNTGLIRLGATVLTLNANIFKIANNGHTAEFILSSAGILTIEIDGVDQGVTYSAT